MLRDIIRSQNALTPSGEDLGAFAYQKQELDTFQERFSLTGT
jgi:hypothetical protein